MVLLIGHHIEHISTQQNIYSVYLICSGSYWSCLFVLLFEAKIIYKTINTVEAAYCDHYGANNFTQCLSSH